MAAFNERDFHRHLDFELLGYGWITLYKKPAILEKDIKWLVEHGYAIYRFSCDQWSSKEVALRDLGLKLDFPDYYGQNLDALNDCLSEIDVPTRGGVAIVLHRYDLFNSLDSRTAYNVLDICADNARRQILSGKRLLVLVQSNDPELSFESSGFGATPASWNRQEWMRKNR